MADENGAPQEKEEKKSKAPIVLLFIPLVVVVVIIAVALRNPESSNTKRKDPEGPRFKMYKQMLEDLKRQIPDVRRCAKEFKRPRIEETVLDVIKALEDSYYKGELILKLMGEQALKLYDKAHSVYYGEYMPLKEEGKDPDRTLLEECRVYLRCRGIIHRTMSDIWDYSVEKKLIKPKPGTIPKFQKDAQVAQQLWSQISKE